MTRQPEGEKEKPEIGRDGTPWITKTDRYGDKVIEDAYGKAIFGDTSYYPWVESDLFQRIVECVNLCATIPNPTAIRGLVEAAEAVVDEIMHLEHPLDCGCPLSRLKSALASLRKGGEGE